MILRLSVNAAVHMAAGVAFGALAVLAAKQGCKMRQAHKAPTHDGEPSDAASSDTSN